VSQLGQVGILPVVQLPARDAQVEAQPWRMGLHLLRPRHFVVAFLLAGTLPSGEEEEAINRQNRSFKVTVKLRRREFTPGLL